MGRLSQHAVLMVYPTAGFPPTQASRHPCRVPGGACARPAMTRQAWRGERGWLQTAWDHTPASCHLPSPSFTPHLFRAPLRSAKAIYRSHH